MRKKIEYYTATKDGNPLKVCKGGFAGLLRELRNDEKPTEFHIGVSFTGIVGVCAQKRRRALMSARRRLVNKMIRKTKRAIVEVSKSWFSDQPIAKHLGLDGEFKIVAHYEPARKEGS